MAIYSTQLPEPELKRLLSNRLMQLLMVEVYRGKLMEHFGKITYLHLNSRPEPPEVSTSWPHGQQPKIIIMLV